METNSTPAAATKPNFIARFYRWLFSWRTARRALIGLALLATLWAVFVAEENWRCKRDWENYKAGKITKGDWHEWDEFVPPPVPDAENVYAAPHIAAAFTRSQKDEYVEDLQKKYLAELARVQKTHGLSFSVGELIFVQPGEAVPANADLEIFLADSATAGQVRQLIDKTVGPICHLPQSYVVFARSPESIKAVRIAVRAERVPDIKELKQQFQEKNWPDEGGTLELRTATDPRAMRMSVEFVPLKSGITPYSLASEYLQASAVNEPFYALIDAALQRPKLRMDSDYKNPIMMPVVNFVRLRNVAQELCARAQCHLLLGQPDKAVHELARLHEIRRLNIDQRPMTLVSAMINVAIFGLYAETIAEGFRLNAWRDEDLAALGKQLGDIDVIPPVILALQMERVFINRLIDWAAGSPKKLSNTYYGTLATVGGKETRLSFTEKVSALLVYCLPNGWLYQNQLYYNQTMDVGPLVAWDTDRGQFHPLLDKQAAKQVEEMATGKKQSRLLAPYNRYARNLLTACAVPNFTRAQQTTVANQTKISEALVACALERYRLARGEYPVTLDALVPQFIGKLPHDLIGGGPLKYRRTDDGKFLLYSIGWNEIDDGGKISRDKDGKVNPSATDGDWVWDAQNHLGHR